MWTRLELSVLMALVGVGCVERDPETVTARAGSPLPGLTDEELTRFRRGRALFDRRFTPEEGLGPLFNEDRCSSCHDLPTSGGTGTETATKATRFEPPDRCDLLEREGGDNIQQRATPLARDRGIHHEPNPPSATARAVVTAPALYGLGLVEAVAPETLEDRSDPEDADGDGISGRVGLTSDGSPGRFGRKADIANLVDFVDTALRFEMGLTTPLHPTEESIGGRPPPVGTDPAPDPEIDRDQFERLIDYVRFLAVPPPERPDSPAARDTLEQGERLFDSIGCSECHVPLMRTGRSHIDALDRKTFRLYSDLLLHDLGSGPRNICGPGATPAEFRTASLVGARHRPEFLHDGRAGSLMDAIRQHGGEAARARTLFERLSDLDRRLLVRFVSSL